MAKPFLLLIGLLLVCIAPAQHTLQRYEFPEFGISIPFFKEAKKLDAKVNGSQSYIQYEYVRKDENSKIIANMYLYYDWGCSRADTFYNMMERYAATAEGNPTLFRPLTQTSHTHYLGWTFYDATLTIDNSRDNVVRKVQGFSNGSQILIIDVNFVNEDFSSIGKEIFDEPGYSSILRPLDLPKLGLRLHVRGNVTSAYDSEENSYHIGRCDRIGTIYPHVVFKQTDGDPNSLSLEVLAQMRQQTDFDKVKLETLPPEDKLARFPGGVIKVTADLVKENGRLVTYLFSFNNQTCKVMLVVPYGPDDNRLFFKSDREITLETAKELDVRVIELLGNLTQIRE